MNSAAMRADNKMLLKIPVLFFPDLFYGH